MDKIKTFRSYLQARGRSPATVSTYISVAQMFLDYAKEKESYTSRDVLGFLVNCGAEGNSKATYWSILRGFFEATDQGWPFKQREGRPRTSLKPPPFLEEEEVRGLLELARGRPLDHAIFRLLAITGMRTDELCNLNREDYQPPRLTIKLSKREGYRVEELDGETTKALDSYLAGRRDANPALFIGERVKKRIQSGVIRQNLRRYFKALGIRKRGLGCHAFRRAYATMLAERGMDVLELKELIGWASIEMPARYVKLKPGKVQAKARELHPLRS